MKTKDWARGASASRWCLLVSTFAFVLSGCQSEASRTGSGASIDRAAVEVAGPSPLFADSFERSSDCVNSITGWRTFLWDRGGCGRAIDLEQRRIGMAILGDEHMGPAADGHRALYFFARRSRGPVELSLISRSFDLSGLKAIELDFKYLVLNLNTVRRSCSVTPGGEYLRAEVCNAGIAECGLSDVLDPSGLNGSVWKTVFEHDPKLNGNSLNGRNHAASDWVPASVKLDLAGYDKTKPLFFRFKARLGQAYSRFWYADHDSDDDYLAGLHLPDSDDFGTQCTDCERFPKKATRAGCAVDDVKVIGTPADGGGGEGPPGGGEGPPVGGGVTPPA